MIPFRQVGIFGLGLMGASLAGALKASGFAGRVVGHSGRPESIREARDRGWIDDGVSGDPAGAARGCDLLVMCAPILRIADGVREALPGLAPDAVITDVGSTKAWLAEHVPALLREAGHAASFVPAHPMCGSEKSGLSAARPDLYRGATTVVCDGPGVSPAARDRVVAFWEGVGCRVARMTAADHDRWAALTSHLPHMAAAALARACGAGETPPGMLDLVGNGLRDTTRVAEGSPAVWSEIAATNGENLLAGLDALAGRVAALRAALADALRTSDWSAFERLLAEAADSRRRLVAGR